MSESGSGGGDYDWAIPFVIVLLGWYLVDALLLAPERANETGSATTTEGVWLGENGTSTQNGSSTNAIDANNQNNETENAGLIEVPDDWPDSVPIPAGVKIEYGGTETEQDGGEVLTVTYTANEKAEVVRNFYESELVRNGWEIEMNTEAGNNLVISASQANEKLAVFITDYGSNEVSVTLSVTRNN